jgi:broad specificity phosphatase PhoE
LQNQRDPRSQALAALPGNALLLRLRLNAPRQPSIDRPIEWDYGRFEGKVIGDVLKERPGWELYRDGCPGGEAPEEAVVRADRFIVAVYGIGGAVLAFSSGHIIRMIAARWLGLAPAEGRLFFCDPASVGVLGFEHENRDQPVIRLWNFVGQ